MRIKKFYTYLADLNPQRGTEPGKTRPVVVIQTDLLNDVHPSTIICPTTTKVVRGSSILRIHIPKGQAGLNMDSDVLVDQIRAIDIRRFIKPLGQLTPLQQEKLLENLKILVLE